MAHNIKPLKLNNFASLCLTPFLPVASHDSFARKPTLPPCAVNNIFERIEEEGNDEDDKHETPEHKGKHSGAAEEARSEHQRMLSPRLAGGFARGLPSFVGCQYAGHGVVGAGMSYSSSGDGPGMLSVSCGSLQVPVSVEGCRVAGWLTVLRHPRLTGCEAHRRFRCWAYHRRARGSSVGESPARTSRHL